MLAVFVYQMVLFVFLMGAGVPVEIASIAVIAVQLFVMREIRSALYSVYK